MAKVDLKSMDIKQLEKLSKDIEKALDRITKKELSAAKVVMNKLLKSHGFTLSDLIEAEAKAKTSKWVPKKASQPSTPKFSDPADKAQTWTGKGGKPEWFKTAIADGKTPEDLSI